MSGVKRVVLVCSTCLQRQQWKTSALSYVNTAQIRSYAESATQRDPKEQSDSTGHDHESTKNTEEPGALSRRLQQMADEAMTTGSKSDRQTMADAGFSEDLKRQLEERIAQSSFQSLNQQASSQATMPSYAGSGTRQQAAAPPWTGTESTPDATLRMLDDATPKLRALRPGGSRATRKPLNMKPASKVQNVSAADRLASARDRTSIYAVSQQSGMSEEEREKMRKELKERFTPGARPMPTSLQGLTSLANERIEDAIARGQFRNIQRGKGVHVEHDYAARSPFLDTTEYFMNKMIQKQEIVPPWIEKQQELIKMVTNFRSRLQHDWRRHAARTISSRGGSVTDQAQRARSFALTEEMLNPRPVRRERMTGIDSTGSLTTITVEERIAAGIQAEKDEIQKGPEVEIQVTESTPGSDPGLPPADSSLLRPEQSSNEDLSTATPSLSSTDSTGLTGSTNSASGVLPAAYLLRDANWEATEAAYHNLAVKEINDLTRSYNLMAPKVAQRSYYTVPRELNRCFAEVAPTIADEILDRSRKPKVRIEVIGHRPGGVMEKFQGSGHVGTIREEDEKKGYGFKEFWRDLFSKNEEGLRDRKRNVV